MTTRRGFIGLLAAGAAAIGLPGIGRAATAPARRGVPGVTYFRAGDVYRLPDGTRAYGLPGHTKLYFNGLDVTAEASEADLSAGWVRMYRVAKRNADGTAKLLATTPTGNTLPQYVAFGRVELRRVRIYEAKTVFCDPGGWVTVRVPVDTKA